MHKGLVLIAIVAMAMFAGIGQTERSDAAFHIMRVYGVMGGAFGDADVQYVEMRMATSGQNFVAGHEICFFDSNGDPWARFTFPSSVGNGANGASVLIGTSEFDANWSAGAPDFVFSSVNTVAINGSADVDHPIPVPAGKVSFGSDSATVPASMCAGSYFLYDSVAYGSGYTGTVDFGTAFATDLPTADTDAVRLSVPVSPPGAPGQNNSTNYAITDVNVSGDYPRNNGGAVGPLSAPVPNDSDGDGVPDISDNCPSWPNPLQNLPPWNVPAGDDDCDGWSTANETSITTAPHDACGFTVGAPPESETWPPDLAESNTINISDVLALKPVFGTAVPPTSARLDMVPSGGINISDVLAVKPFFGKSCAP